MRHVEIVVSEREYGRIRMVLESPAAGVPWNDPKRRAKALREMLIDGLRDAENALAGG